MLACAIYPTNGTCAWGNRLHVAEGSCFDRAACKPGASDPRAGSAAASRCDPTNRVSKPDTRFVGSRLRRRRLQASRAFSYHRTFPASQADCRTFLDSRRTGPAANLIRGFRPSSARGTRSQPSGASVLVIRADLDSNSDIMYSSWGRVALRKQTRCSAAPERGSACCAREGDDTK